MELLAPQISYMGLKEKSKLNTDNLSYCDIFLLSAAAMFEYVHAGTDKPFEDIETAFIDLYALTNGTGAILRAKEFPQSTLDGESLIVAMAARAGGPNANGLGKDLICTTLDGRNVTIRNFETDGKDSVVYFKNNKFGTPDFTIGESGFMMAEIKKSLRHNVINSRLTPIVVAKDAKCEKQITKALEENKAGSYAVVVSDNITADGQEFVLNVTDVKDQDKIQYLNHAYDDELRHWYNLHGLDITGASKQAQQTEAEVSSGANSRLILANDMLAERIKMAERLNELYGLDIEVRFSLPWRREFGLEMSPVEEAEEDLAEAPEAEAEAEAEENEEGSED